ncbi:MAG: class I SAM-dependent methyltransferase, partial [Phycisphaerales bacterium]
GYFEVVLGKPPRETLIEALRRFEEDGGEPGFAIDLGCGEGRDSAELLRRGWRVLAIDGHDSAFEFLKRRTDFPRAAKDPGRFETVVARMEDAELPPCDLLNASFSLPFVDPSRFDEVWARIVQSVKPGGRFAGQLFGERDTWASLPDRSHQTRARVDELLAAFDVEHFQEEERDGGDCMNTPKHWHVFHIVARKRG